MSARDDTRRDLQRAARDGKIDAGELSFSTASEGIGLLLAEIEQAVLGRELHCVFEDGARLTCLAGGRRLHRFLPPAPDGVPDHGLFGAADLSSGETEATASFLKAVFDGHSQMTLQSQPPKTRLEITADTGLSVEALSRATGAVPIHPKLPQGADVDIVDAFVEALAEKLIAAIWIEGDAVSSVHNEAGGQKLSDWAMPRLDRFLAPSFPLAAGLETDAILMIEQPGGRQRIILGSLGNFLVAETNCGASQEPVDLWRELKQRLPAGENP